MNRIMRLISVIGSGVASLFTMGCQREPECIYGPPQMLDDYRRTGQIHPDKSSESETETETQKADEEPSTLPETEGEPSKIYGPPEMLNGDDYPSYIQQVESDGTPLDVYGPPPMDEEPE